MKKSQLAFGLAVISMFALVAGISGKDLSQAELTKQAGITGDIGDDLAAVPDMVSGGDDIDAGGIEFAADLVCDAEAGGGVLAIDDDEIEGQLAAETRQVFDHARPSRAADDVAAEQNSHRRPARPR